MFICSLSLLSSWLSGIKLIVVKRSLRWYIVRWVASINFYRALHLRKQWPLVIDWLDDLKMSSKIWCLDTYINQWDFQSIIYIAYMKNSEHAVELYSTKQLQISNSIVSNALSPWKFMKKIPYSPFSLNVMENFDD